MLKSFKIEVILTSEAILRLPQRFSRICEVLLHSHESDSIIDFEQMIH